MNFYKLLVLVLFFFPAKNLFAQKDTSIKKVIDSLTLKKQKINIFKVDTSKPYNPKYAILRSAIIPGWGQATNKKYWKMPLVVGALGTTIGVFFYNIKQYNQIQAAYKNFTDNDTSNDKLITGTLFSYRNYPEQLKTIRNQVRQNVDYSVLFFIAFWGLNVVDAAVDAHLKTFDVSDKLSVQIKPGHSQMANTNGISLVLNIHSKFQKSF